MKRKKAMEDIVLDTIIYLVLILITLVTLYPLWYVLAASFSTGTELASHTGLFLWPDNASFDAYKLVFQDRLIMSGLENTLIILAVSLPINITMTLLCGYFMACNGMMWKKYINAIILTTMFFSGGIIPAFLNIKSLGLYNNLWSLILPSALSVYNAIICKTAIEAIPESLKESAYIDGANDFQIIFKIIMPLIKPTLAVILLYYGVSHWNAWFNASIYIKDNSKLPVQNIIRAILLENQQTMANSSGDRFNAYADTIKYAAIVITTVPILCVYPFLQKHFTKGVMIGAVKG